MWCEMKYKRHICGMNKRKKAMEEEEEDER
jgi:hypothetical protein